MLNLRLYMLQRITALLMAPFNLLGVVLGALLPGNEDLYLDNVVLARCHGCDRR